MINFDLVSENNFLKLYRYASVNNIPARYIISNPINVISDDPIELQKITISTLNDDINEESDIIKLITKYILTSNIDYVMDIIFLYYEKYQDYDESKKLDFKNILVNSKYISEDFNLDDEYKNWKERINEEINQDKIVMKSYEEYLTYVNNFKESYISKPFIKDFKLSITIDSNDKPINIFNKILCTLKLILVKYNNGFQKFFKLYEDENLNYDFEKINNIDIKDQHMLFIFNIEDKYIYMDYDITLGSADVTLENNKSIDYDIVDILVNEIKNLPIKILRINYYDLNGYFGIYGIPFYDDIMASYILNEENTFLFINEKTKPLFDQNQLFITYITPDEIKYGIHKYTIRIHYDIEKLQDDIQYNIMYKDPITNKLVSDYKDKQYIINNMKNINNNFEDLATIINFSNASLDTLYYFMFYLNKISYNYFNSIDKYKNEYKMYLPNYQLNVKYVKDPILGMKKIQILKDKSKELIVSGYARICQKDKQPNIVDEEEYIRNINNSSYTVIESLGRNKKYYYKCPDNIKYRYAVKLKNTKLSNTVEFPEIPCCSEHEETKGQKKFSEFITFEKDKILIQNPIIQERINNAGVVSKPLKIDKILNNKLILNMDFNYKSFINSIYLIMYIINNGLFNSINILDQGPQNNGIYFDHEKYKEQIKQTYKHLTFMRQELYDVEYNEMMNTFLNNDVEDEEYYYKFVSLFEEIMDINIYVIENNEFVRPRYKFNHFKRLRKNGVILSRRLQKQYNIVLNMDGENYKNILLDEEENKKFNSIYMNFSYLSKGKIKNYDDRNKIDILNKLYKEYSKNEIEPSYQLIDGYGKCRGFIYNNITYIIEPDQPYNVEETRNIKNADFNLIYNIYSKYIRNIDYDENLLYGIWLDYNKLNIYIPVNPININLNYPIGDKNPYSIAIKTSSYFRYLKLEDNLIKILQILYWLIIIGHKENINILNLLYLDTKNPEIDSSNEYNIENIPQEGLPKVNNIYEALTWLYNQNTKLIIIVDNNYKIRMYSDKFFYGIQYYIKEFIRHNNIAELNHNDIQFRRKFHTSKDFDIGKNNTLLIGDRAFNNWKIYYNKIKTKKYEFNVLIKIDHNYIDPYYFTYQDEYYIIQNVKEGNLNRAMQVSLNWYQNKINTGYNTELSQYIYSYILYDKSFMKISEFGTPEEVKFQILQLNGNKYAAILKIL